jgi:signal transduction histidine kinase
MREIPFWHRLGTRLTVLILVVVAVLALATGILLVRGFDLVVQDAMAAAGGAEPEIGGIVRATVINLIAIFLFTLVGAAVFSRTLLTEPIAQLVRGTRELTAGRLGTTLPVTSRSELGRLAEDFNAMSRALAESREHLEQRVAERTAELRALLEISNATALTLEPLPLLEVLLDRLEDAAPVRGAAVVEVARDGSLERLAARGEALPDAAARPALSAGEEATVDGVRALPLRIRGTLAGALLLRPEGPLPEARLRIVRAFANQASVALENAQLYDRVQEQAASEERQHLARELHDSVSQALYAILLGTHTAQRHVAGAPDKASDALAYVENLAQAGIAEMRALIFELRPESLEEEGLAGVLTRQVEALRHRHGLEADADVPEEPELPFATRKVVFRVAQEAIHNVVKHARAQQVHVALRREGDAWALRVRDDGQGFDLTEHRGPHGAPGHLGLVSMRERVEALGGSLTLESEPGAGTCVIARVPVASLPENGRGRGESRDGRAHRGAPTPPERGEDPP